MQYFLNNNLINDADTDIFDIKMISHLIIKSSLIIQSLINCTEQYCLKRNYITLIYNASPTKIMVSCTLHIGIHYLLNEAPVC